MIISEIVVPLLNANEPEARLVHIHIKDGKKVKKGEVLATIETTKAASDIDTPESGFVYFFATEGDVLQVGKRIAIISDEEGDYSDVKPESIVKTDGSVRMTQPARALAKKLGVEENELPSGILVTQDVVRQYAQKRVSRSIEIPTTEKPAIIIYGAGGHAKSVMEIVLQNGDFSIAGIIDDNDHLTGTSVLNIPVLGTGEILADLVERGVTLAANGVGGILNIAIRIDIFRSLEQAGLSTPSLIHPRATIEPSSKVSYGVQIFANAYIGSEAVLHDKCMVNTNAVVSHDCEIGSYSHIAPGALLAGHVHVGEKTLIGMGVTTTIGIRIGSGVRIGNGAIILADVPDNMIIQAGRYWVGKQD
jgi:sugar O-acyltransferase (sialic acid O-acetyltransferase NeuD family)